VVIALTWLNNRSLEPDEVAPPEAAATAPADPGNQAATAPAQAPQPQPAATSGPVVLTATAPAWIQVTDQGKTLFIGELAPGQSFTVPQTATAPLLKAGKPEALRVNVGTAVAPPVGPPGRVASKVSLLSADLMRGGSAAPASAGTPATPAASAPPGVQTNTQ